MWFVVTELELSLLILGKTTISESWSEGYCVIWGQTISSDSKLCFLSLCVMAAPYHHLSLGELLSAGQRPKESSLDGTQGGVEEGRLAVFYIITLVWQFGGEHN